MWYSVIIAWAIWTKKVLKEIKAQYPETVVLIMTGYSDIKTAVDVMKMGAFDYISKPLIPDEVLNVLNKASQDSGEAPTRSTNGNRASGQKNIHGLIL